MRQSDFFTPSTRPTQATAPTSSTVAVTLPASATTATAGFGSVYRQVQNEVNAFINKGFTASAGASTGGAASTATAAAAPTLSPEGMAYLERSQPAGALASINGEQQQLQQEFLASIKPWTEETGQRLGVAPELVAAHAALESGWGQRPLLQGNGGDTNNLFGIKAGGKWQGEVAAATTTEYSNGAALKKTERFRSYPDQASAFRDYAQVLLDNPRYRAALGTGNDAHAFAQGLARGGYATDPAYADKLSRLANRLQQSKITGD